MFQLISVLEMRHLYVEDPAIIEVSSLLLVLLRPQLTFVLQFQEPHFKKMLLFLFFLQKNHKNNYKIMSHSKNFPHLLHIPTQSLGIIAAIVGRVKKEMTNFVIIKQLIMYSKKENEKNNYFKHEGKIILDRSIWRNQISFWREKRPC